MGERKQKNIQHFFSTREDYINIDNPKKSNTFISLDRELMNESKRPQAPLGRTLELMSKRS